MINQPESCDHSDCYPGLPRRPCYCDRPGCTRTDTGTSNDICPHWAEDRIKQLDYERARLNEIAIIQEMAVPLEKCKWSRPDKPTGGLPMHRPDRHQHFGPECDLKDDPRGRHPR